MDWLLILAIATFVLVVGFLVWSRMSAKRHQETGGHTEGIGGPNDPLSGATKGIRKAEDLRSGLDTAVQQSDRS
jgi:hypothetical protein